MNIPTLSTKARTVDRRSSHEFMDQNLLKISFLSSSVNDWQLRKLDLMQWVDVHGAPITLACLSFPFSFL